MIVLVDTSAWIRFLSNRSPDAAGGMGEVPVQFRPKVSIGQPRELVDEQ
jgi:hypothetical protein